MAQLKWEAALCQQYDTRLPLHVSHLGLSVLQKGKPALGSLRSHSLTGHTASSSMSPEGLRKSAFFFLGGGGGGKASEQTILQVHGTHTFCTRKSGKKVWSGVVYILQVPVPLSFGVRYKQWWLSIRAPQKGLRIIPVCFVPKELLSARNVPWTESVSYLARDKVGDQQRNRSASARLPGFSN